MGLGGLGEGIRERACGEQLGRARPCPELYHAHIVFNWIVTFRIDLRDSVGDVGSVEAGSGGGTALQSAG